jgi:hypothetical protein
MLTEVGHTCRPKVASGSLAFGEKGGSLLSPLVTLFGVMEFVLSKIFHNFLTFRFSG